MTKYRYDISNGSLKIIFPKTVIMGEVDKEVTSFFSQNHDLIQPLILDFSQSEYVEVVCLIYFLSILADRKQNYQKTFIKLPKYKDVRDFFRSWRFPEAVKEVTGTSFWNTVLEEDHEYFGENKNLEDEKYTGKTLFDAYGKTTKLLENYLPILTFHHHASTEFDSILALGEADRWKRQVVSSVLEKHLEGSYGYFASRIVFEAIMNAIRHPNASHILTASHVNWPIKNTKSRGFFTLIWWDNGKSILDTLREPLSRNEKINSESTQSIARTSYKLVCEDADKNEISSQLVHSNLIPDQNISDELLLLAATFPGITRDISGRGHLTHPDLGKEKLRSKTEGIPTSNILPLKQPGMGLHLLMNAAIYIFGGRLAFRTGEFFMSVKRPSQKDKNCDYAVTIRRYSNKFKFLGNMLTVRLPLQNQ